mmetsp:Transcript_79856/g.222351  ORF Transcript_79856/g.222351 Transcript_79856/m.222351 type:complete len:337 (+) Transcript_79856:6104-7114(+)
MRHRPISRQGIHDRVVVECGQVRIIGFDIHDALVVVRRHGHLARPRVVEEGECDTVLRAQLLAHDDLVNVVELVPVLVLVVHVAVKGLELGPPRNRHVQGLRRVERLLLEEVEVVTVHKIGQQLVRQTVEHALLRKAQAPLAVARAVHLFGIEERHGVVKPVDDRLVLGIVETHLDSLKGLHIEHVVAIVKRGLFIIERREAHSLEVAPVALLPPHHDPHRPPLGHVDRLDDLLNFGTERDGATAVVHCLTIPDLRPRYRRVLEELVHRMRQILQGPQIDPLVVPELPRRHVPMVLDDLANVFGRHLLFLLLNDAKLPLLAVALGVQGLPFPRLLV